MPALTIPNAVVWDMDGTLIDQTIAIVACYREVIQELGYAAPEVDIIHRSLGGPMRSTLELFVKDSEIEEASKRFRARFPEIMFDGLVILPSALEITESIHMRGIPQAILTNKHGDTAREVSHHCGFAEYIEVCIGNKDTEFSKPDRKLTNYVLDALEVDNSGTCLIGDSPTDVATALNAGLICYGVATGAHSAEELLNAGATAAFVSLTDLDKAFGGL